MRLHTARYFFTGKLITLLLSLLLLNGCVTQPLLPHSNKPGLDQWVEADLIPYLSQKLSTHPRLRGQSFTVVRMSGGDIQPSIDGLTLDLRHRLTDALADTPGVRMLWLPTREHRHHRRLRGADCGDSLRADYFIGIESDPQGDGRWRVAVRILDAREGTWISGLGQHWRGRLEPNQQQASQQVREDELLRGQRVLPFTAGQPDLAAAYFANNLSCLLRQQDLSESRLYVKPPENTLPQLATLASLLDNYLSRLHQVRITSRPQDADHLVNIEAHLIEPGLHQVWVSLQPKDSGEHVAGLDTAAYVSLEQGLANAPVTNAPVTAPPMPKPRPPARPSKPAGGPKISGLQLLRPASSALCRDPDPWQSGQIPLRRGDSLSADGCYMVRTHTEQTERLFLLLLGPDGTLRRLTPGSCGRSHAFPSDGDARLSYPEDRRPMSLARHFRPRQSGVGTLYAIAVNNAYLASRLQNHLLQLPDICDEKRASTQQLSLQTWSRELDRLLDSRPHYLDWTALRFRFNLETAVDRFE